MDVQNDRRSENIPVYVAHYDKAVHRRFYLTKTLKGLGFNKVEFSTYYCDRGTIYNDVTRKLVNTSKSLSSQKHRVSRMKSGYQTLSETEPAYLGNFLNHIKIWESIANGEHDYGLILEDDAVITERSLLHNQLNNIPDNLDIGYMHAGCGYTVQTYYGMTPDDSELWVSTPMRLSRTMCSYLLSRECARKLLRVVFPVSWPIDHEINYLQNALFLNVYWTNHHAIQEGSATGANCYTSLVR